jgi:hypothetical protein
MRGLGAGSRIPCQRLVRNLRIVLGVMGGDSYRTSLSLYFTKEEKSMLW